MSKPNIILYHLESLNYLNFSYFRDYFPNLNQLLGKSVLYNNYYSSATSTLMTITDLIYQNTETFESSTYLEDIFSIDFSVGSRLTDLLAARGYKIKISYYEKDGDFNETSFERFCNIIADNPDICLAGSMEELLDNFSNLLPNDQPFFFYVQNIESHIGQISYINTNCEMSNRQLYLERYIVLDNSIGKLIHILKAMNLYDDTCIILYGDHGDELWGHGFHQGYMHAYEPYNNMIHCPLILHHRGQTCGRVDDSLLSTIDIGSMIVKMIDSDVFDIEKKNAVYSRNLFSCQKNNVKIFNKSYSVTNGKYILIVTQDGLKMYFNSIDPFSSRNLLDFFIISNNSIKYNSIFNYLQSSHYKSFMTPAQISELIESFIFLKQGLKNFVNKCYGGKQSEMRFNKIVYSGDVRMCVMYTSWRAFSRLSKRVIKKIIDFREWCK